MKVYHMSANTTVQQNDGSPCVMALGFFDGLHVAHQQVIRTARQIADALTLPLAVMTFFPHPKQIIGASKAPVRYITPIKKKIEKLAALNVDALYLVHFDKMFASLSAQEYVDRYLIANQVQHVVAGFDFKYGYKGEGNIELLKVQGGGQFEVTSVKEIRKDGVKISSTQIRSWISKGELELLHDCLGHDYEMDGQLRFTSPNKAEFIYDQLFMIPKDGFYEVQVYDHGRSSVVVCEVTGRGRRVQLHFHSPVNRWIGDVPIQLRWRKRLNEGWTRKEIAAHDAKQALYWRRLETV